MKLCNRSKALIYKIKKGSSSVERHSEVKQYPSVLQGDCSLPFLFSSNFKYYIDMNLTKSQFVIRETQKLTRGKGSKQMYWPISRDIIDLRADKVDLN